MTHAQQTESFSTRTVAEQLVTAGEAERATGLPGGFLATARRGSSGPAFHKLGRKSVFYLLSEVRSWLADCACDPRAPREPGTMPKESTNDDVAAWRGLRESAAG
jgi:hypothetical protein